MKLSKSKIIGLIALLAVVGVVCGTLVWRQSQPAPAEPTEQVSITGYLGGEKIGLFDDAKFKALANLDQAPGAVAVLDATDDEVRAKIRAPPWQRIRTRTQRH